MKLIKIIDCNQVEHNLNVEFIYNVNSFDPGFKQPHITQVCLHHNKEENPFFVFKTYESISSFVQRLNECK